MAEIGKPTTDEPIEVPDPVTEPLRRELPAETPKEEPAPKREKVPAAVLSGAGHRRYWT